MFRKNKVVWVSVAIVAAMLCGMGAGAAMAKVPSPLPSSATISPLFMEALIALTKEFIL